ncbi:MAG: ATP-binding protein [Bacteroidia bacterium]|nr:ATP-binding protein [Bacteroidia bacterium]
MKKIFYTSAIFSIMVVFLISVGFYFISSFWLAGILSFCFVFAGGLLMIFFIKKYSERQMVQHIYEQLKELSSKKSSGVIENKKQLDEFIRDIIQERKKEQEYFKNLDSYRKEYLGNVSHELKTPLFNIQGYVSTLIDDAMNDKEILSEYLKKTDKNIERMINIIDDLETISQLESGAMILDYELFDLEQLINEVFEQMELVAKAKGITFKLVKEPNEYFIANADKFRIRQVFNNLLSNSVKYGKENGKTTITIKKEQGKILISVADNGIGIDEKHLPRIFERFYRVDKGRSREQGGTGLGLAIVKHIIEAHKQTISVQSELGKGTVFTFTLDSK